MTPDSLRPIAQASFGDLKMFERKDLQRLLRSRIEVLGEELYLLAEEFALLAGQPTPNRPIHTRHAYPQSPQP